MPHALPALQLISDNGPPHMFFHRVDANVAARPYADFIQVETKIFVFTFVRKSHPGNMRTHENSRRQTFAIIRKC